MRDTPYNLSAEDRVATRKAVSPGCFLCHRRAEQKGAQMTEHNPQIVLPNEPGIYMITCVANGRRYVGSAYWSIRRRKNVHWSCLRKGRGNRHIQACWSKYGEESFVCTVLELCPRELCIEREQFWMDKLKPELNVLPTAGSNAGCRQTPESVAKRAAKIRGSRRPDMVGNTFVKGKTWTVPSRRRPS